MATLIEYPETLPAPLSGKISPTERRAISEVPGRPNYRVLQRDYHGTKDISFIYTPDEAAKFRFWWAKWLARGAGWFVADWPLLPQRKDNVFRFTKPPQWTLEGGGINGQGYWRVSATVEIRGRGMLPDMFIDSRTSRPYPIEELDLMEAAVTEARGPAEVAYRDLMDAAFTDLGLSGSTIVYRTYDMGVDDMTATFTDLNLTGTYVIYTSYSMGIDTMDAAFTDVAITMTKVLITYENYEPELLTATFDSLTLS